MTFAMIHNINHCKFLLAFIFVKIKFTAKSTIRVMIQFFSIWKNGVIRKESIVLPNSSHTEFMYMQTYWTQYSFKRLESMQPLQRSIMSYFYLYNCGGRIYHFTRFDRNWFCIRVQKLPLIIVKICVTIQWKAFSVEMQFILYIYR